jgi:hypothetical protein
MVTLKPQAQNKAMRVILIGTGEGETDQHLMAWFEMNMTSEPWKETFIVSAWNDKKIVGPHYEITSCSNRGAGGVTRPISFWMNEENPTKHVKVFEINPKGVEGKTFMFQNGWALTETSDGKGIQLVRPDGSVAKEWQ